MGAVQLRGLYLEACAQSDVLCSLVAAVFVVDIGWWEISEPGHMRKWLTDLAMFRLGRKKETKENHHNQVEEGIRLFGGLYYGPG